MTVGEGVAEVELLDDIVADAAAAEILLANGDAVGVVLQNVLEILHRPIIDDQHRLAVVLLLSLLVGQFLLLNLDVILPCQPAQGLGIGDLLVLYQEVDGRATLAAGKALAYLLRRRHHERRCLVVVERAQPLVVHARLPQRHELTDHIHDVRGIHDLVYRLSVNHSPAKLSIISRIYKPLTKNLPHFTHSRTRGGYRQTRLRWRSGWDLLQGRRHDAPHSNNRGRSC